MRNLTIAKQIHSSRVKTVFAPSRFSHRCDGLVTSMNDIPLAVYGADCALIAFWDHKKIGICHAGWRGLTSDIIGNMKYFFDQETLKCSIAPFLHRFEIKKDDCYEKIKKSLGDNFFIHQNDITVFDFKSAILHAIGNIPYSIDDRSTYDHIELASWRRDGQKGNGTQNRFVIMKNDQNSIFTKVYEPGQKLLTLV